MGKNISFFKGFVSLALTCASVITATSCSSGGNIENGGTKSHVVVAGSTSVQPYMEVLAEEYVKFYPDSAVDVQGGGSSAGISAVGSGIADIGMSSRSLSESEVELYQFTTIAKDGLALIVHPENPVDNLTLEQIRDIYTGEITDWSQVSDQFEGDIFPITREEGSGTRSFFEEFVMDGQRITSKAIVQSTNGTIRTLVSGNARGNKQAIGFISLGVLELPGQNPVKGLQIGGVAPTTENLANGSYELFRPFLVVVGEEREESTHFIDFILSDTGQGLLEARGLVRIDGG
ncbi:MAG: phosphate ABC transporter substrate-binding protein [Oscillospiraceae bacterium]|nr:phosphate ABC transporter substrate-binding protein [Oscillospiraceae bacterium]